MKVRLIAVSSCVLLFVSTMATTAGSVHASANWVKVATAAGYLYDVTCVTTTDCWSVGAQGSGASKTVLIEHYDGTAWATYPSPSLAPPTALFGVTCVTADDCWAVGSSHIAGPTLLPAAVIEHYDGTSWSEIPAPGTALYGVACTSHSSCWATGNFDNAIEHYDGTAWSVAFDPAAGNPQYEFYRVQCPAADDCWAVGRVGTAPPMGGLIAHYDGSQWSLVAEAQPPVDVAVDDVACPSASDCWAVGCQSPTCSSGTAQHFDGTSWSEALVQGGAASGELTGVACSSAATCWAVNGFADSAHSGIAAWDGRTWSFSGVDFNAYAVTCLTSGECWATGGDITHLASPTTSPSPSPTATPTPTASPSPSPLPVPNTGAYGDPSQAGAVAIVLCGLVLSVVAIGLWRRRRTTRTPS